MFLFFSIYISAAELERRLKATWYSPTGAALRYLLAGFIYEYFQSNISQKCGDKTQDENQVLHLNTLGELKHLSKGYWPHTGDSGTCCHGPAEFT